MVDALALSFCFPGANLNTFVGLLSLFLGGWGSALGEKLPASYLFIYFELRSAKGNSICATLCELFPP